MTKDTVKAARVAMMRARSAAEGAAYYAEPLTGVRMVRVDEVCYGQDIGLTAQAADALRAIPSGERSEVAAVALEALEAWEEARELYNGVGADLGGMVQVWAAEDRAVSAYFRVKGLAG